MSDHVEHPDSSERPRRSPRVFPWLLLLALCLTAGAVYGVRSRRASDTALANWTSKQAVPTVSTITAKAPTDAQKLALPADVEAFYTARIHARVNGYVKMWYRDIGSRVKAGDVLADIDTPELDQQLAQAKGELDKAKADLALAELTAARWSALRKSQAVSQQTADEKAGDAVAHKAQVSASQANFDRLQAMANFKKLTSPFDGIVTARRVDVGALVSSTGSDHPALFDVASTGQMRVYVRVPQVYMAQLHPGMTATLSLPQYPGRSFVAKLDTTSDAISRESRALLVELIVDNRDRYLSPGAYAEVRFDLPLDRDKLVLPANAIIFRNKGTQVAVVESDDHVRLEPVEIIRDTGSEVQITGKITSEDRIINSPSETISTGDVVRVASMNGKPAAQDTKAQASNQ